jgi:hypothetical protein
MVKVDEEPGLFGRVLGKSSASPRQKGGGPILAQESGGCHNF